MKRGHVTGTKRERKGASDWYREREEENIRKVEAEWQAKQAQDTEATMQTNAGGEAKKAEPIRNIGQKVGRNDPCPCGSGKKYKNCHMKLEAKK